VLAERQVVVGIGERRAVDACTPPSAAEQARTGAALQAPPTTAGGGARAFRYGLRVPARQRRSTVLRRGVLVRATCPATCVVRTTLRRVGSRRPRVAQARTVVGARRLTLKLGKARSYRVRLSAAARRELRRGRLSQLNVRFDGRSPAGDRLEARRVRFVR
jgi:hypothetical protein